MAAKKDTLINMFVALFVICVVSGGVLGVVYNATKEPIAAAETAKKTEAIKNVLPEFETLKDIYEVMRRHIKDSDCFLSHDELQELKGNPEIKFLSGGHHQNGKSEKF